MHLFEFMDQNWLPRSLRNTLRDILKCGNSMPFRPYYRWVAAEVAQTAHKADFHTVAELGAGPAPITEHALKEPSADGLQFIVSDANPDVDVYNQLKEMSEGRVQPLLEPIDFSIPRDWGNGVLLVLSATLHHIPPIARVTVLDSLLANGNQVLVFEPLRKTFLSGLFTFLSLVPALVTPVWFTQREGMLRRIFWCWLCPIAPPMFVWDGIVSCLRQWTSNEWREFAVNQDTEIEYKHELFTQFVSLSRKVHCQELLPNNSKPELLQKSEA